MANYFEMTRDELTAEKEALEEEYKKFQAMGLKLNMDGQHEKNDRRNQPPS